MATSVGNLTVEIKADARPALKSLRQVRRQIRWLIFEPYALLAYRVSVALIAVYLACHW